MQYQQRHRTPPYDTRAWTQSDAVNRSCWGRFKGGFCLGILFVSYRCALKELLAFWRLNGSTPLAGYPCVSVTPGSIPSCDTWSPLFHSPHLSWSLSTALSITALRRAHTKTLPKAAVSYTSSTACRLVGLSACSVPTSDARIRSSPGLLGGGSCWVLAGWQGLTGPAAASGSRQAVLGCFITAIWLRLQHRWDSRWVKQKATLQ